MRYYEPAQHQGKQEVKYKKGRLDTGGDEWSGAGVHEMGGQDIKLETRDKIKQEAADKKCE